MELTRKLLSAVCVLAGAGDRLNLTLHWLVHKRVKFEVIPGEVYWGISPIRWLDSDNGYRELS